MVDFSKLDEFELVSIYSDSIKELRKRKIIRTNNVIGDLGEYLAIEYYCKTAGLPKLQAAPVGTQNVDALSTNGKRYTIKSTSGNTTGVFYGLNPKGSEEINERNFEYVIICKFDNDYKLIAIYELTWDDFLKHKKWHKTMNAWNLTISRTLIADSTTIYCAE